MAIMTARDRVLTALCHREPDRVPLDIGGGTSTSIIVEGYEKLKQHLGISRQPRLLNRIFHVAWLDEEVMQLLGSDCRPVVARPLADWTPPASGPATYVDVWGVTWKQAFYASDAYYWEMAKHPLPGADVADLLHYSWPDPLDAGYTAGLAEDTRRQFEETDYCLVGDGGFKSLWETAYFLRGYENLLLDLTLDPAFARALLDRILAINLAATDRFLEAVGPYIQVFRMGDDLATQSGLLMSPHLFRSFLKPLYKTYIEFVRSKTQAKVFFHSCGNVTDLIHDLVEIGVDILNPVQVSAMGDSALLKKRFSDVITFWGGIDTQHVLPHGIVQGVEDEVKRRIHDLAPGGGFVLASVHDIQPDVPPENIVAMAEATRIYGAYPLSV